MALDLNQSPRTSVFRKLVSILRTDPTIKRVLGRPDQIRAWEGKPQDTLPLDKACAPCVRLTPTSGADVFWTPGATRGPLFVQVEMIVSGTNADDLQNLWWAIVRAIYPATQSATNANVQALQQAGAYTGMAQFTLPVFDPNPQDTLFFGSGTIMIEVNNQLLAG